MSTRTFDVRATEQHGRVVFWEVDSRHPEGEAFVAGDERTYTVAETPAVLKALAAGEIERVDEAESLDGPAEGEQIDGTTADGDTLEPAVRAFDLTDLDGVGSARADALRAAGIEGRQDLFDADANELAEAVDGVTAEMVAGWQEQVKE